MQKISLHELFFSFFFISVLSIIVLLSERFIAPNISIFIFIFAIVFGMHIFSYIIKRKAGVFSFLVVYSIFTISVPEIGLVGFEKIVAFAIAGVIFELVFRIIASFTTSRSSMTFISTVITVTLLPLISSYFLSAELTRTLPLRLLNLVALTFIVTIISSAIFIVVWYYVKNTKSLLKFESFLGVLERK
tara:strand:+ start:277 stop:843 length:567 start_codon:yes stop_codon:yes gene_type:complete